ncbi:MAG: RimK/LysX family protein [Cryomorphaceae bacterium]
MNTFALPNRSRLLDNRVGEKRIVGNKEKVSFPDQNREHIVARIDSGARSSSVHCDEIWEEEMRGKKVLCCHFLKRSKKVVRFNKFKRRKIKSSNGQIETRYIVEVKIKLGDCEKMTQVSLNDRSTMNYSVLLGRRFLANDFLIDVSRSYVQNEL